MPTDLQTQIDNLRAQADALEGLNAVMKAHRFQARTAEKFLRLSAQVGDRAFTISDAVEILGCQAPAVSKLLQRLMVADLVTSHILMNSNGSKIYLINR